MSDERPRTRAGTAARHAVLEVLARAYADGQLDHEEFDERHSACFAARYTDELEALTTDLAVEQPSSTDLVHRGAQLPVTGAEPRRFRSISVMSGKDVHLGPEHSRMTSFVWWGGENIYVRDVMGAGAHVVLTLIVVMGGNKIFVPPGVRVIDSSINVMGGNDIAEEASGDGSNGTLELRGFNWWGGTEIVLDPRSKQGWAD